MSRADYPYDEDEFDVLGADRTPQGVHRAPVSRWRQLLPVLLVIVIVPVLAWVGVSALSGEFDRAPEPTPTVATDPTTPEETDGEEGDEGEESPGEEETEAEPEPEPTEEPTEDPVDLNQDVTIVLLNGSGIAGIAGRTAEFLNNEGWPNTTAGDYGFAQPTASTVYYNRAEIAEEAAFIAELFGVSEVVESASAATTDLVLVIRQDFTEPGQ